MSASLEIERVLRDVSARRLRTHKLAKRELLSLADQLENVPTIVQNGSLATAVLFMAQSKDYYRYIGVEILIRVMSSSSPSESIAPQKDFFYHTLMDMIDNYEASARTAGADTDVLHRKMADRVSVMRRTADRLRKMTDASGQGTATSTASAAPVAASLKSPSGSRIRKGRRSNTASVSVATSSVSSPLSATSTVPSSNERAEFDAKVAGLDGAAMVGTQLVDGARAPSRSATDDDIDFVEPPPPPLPGSLKRNLSLSVDAAGTRSPLLPPPPLPDSLPRNAHIATADDDDDDDTPLPPPPPMERPKPPPPLPDENGGVAPPPLPDEAPSIPPPPPADELVIPPKAASPSVRPGEADALKLRKSASMKSTRRKRDTLKASPPRDELSTAQTTPMLPSLTGSASSPSVGGTVRPTSAAPTPPRGGSIPTSPRGGTPEPQDELKQLKMRMMLAAGALGSAQQAVVADDSWTNQMALARAQADCKAIQEKITDVQQRLGAPSVQARPVAAKQPSVRLTSSSSSMFQAVRSTRTASIDASTGHVADVKTAEEAGREERLLDLFGSIQLTEEQSSEEARGADTVPMDNSSDGSQSARSNPSATPPAVVMETDALRASTTETTFGVGATESAAPSDESGTKPRPMSSDGADARLLTDARQLKRMYAAQEILETEVRYIQCLESMVDNYKRELERMATTSGGPQPLANQAQIRLLFSNAQAILNTNRVLLNQVRSRVGQWDAHSMLGDIFIRMANFFKIYIEYANNYDAAHELFESLIDSNEAFERFCEAMELRDGLDLGLEDLLIMPVQRLPRYVMLLETLLKYTPAAHPDFDSLTQAAGKIQEISQQINDTNREVEQRRRVFEIHQSLAPGSVSIAAPHRIFKREANAVYYDHDSSKQRRCQVYLFNDLLLITQSTKQSTSAAVLATVSLRTARTARIADQKGVRDGDDIANAMVLIDMQHGAGGGQHILCWSSSEERDSWLADVDEAKSDTIHAMISKNSH